MISIGTIGLIKAVSTFDSGKNNRLATYAARCIENELLIMFRMKKKTTKEVSLYDPIGTDKEGNEISLFDIIEGENIDIIEKMEFENKVEKLYQLLEEVLSEREKKVIRLRYGVCGAGDDAERLHISLVSHVLMCHELKKMRLKN